MFLALIAVWEHEHEHGAESIPARSEASLRRATARLRHLADTLRAVPQDDGVVALFLQSLASGADD